MDLGSLLGGGGGGGSPASAPSFGSSGKGASAAFSSVSSGDSGLGINFTPWIVAFAAVAGLVIAAVTLTYVAKALR